MRLEKLNLEEVAAQLDRPFSMVDMVVIGDLMMSLYLCQGLLAWHRHLDQDELFWVHRGAIFLESERGLVRLRPGELAVVRKGLAHRSGSPLRSTVILLRCAVAPNRKNGQRRLYGTREGAPQRVSLVAPAEKLGDPFQPQTVACIEDALVQVAQGEGIWPVPEPALHDILLVTLKGAVTVETDGSVLTLHPDDLTVIPRGNLYRLSSMPGTILVQVTREGMG